MAKDPGVGGVVRNAGPARRRWSIVLLSGPGPAPDPLAQNLKYSALVIGVSQSTRYNNLERYAWLRDLDIVSQGFAEDSLSPLP